MWCAGRRAATGVRACRRRVPLLYSTLLYSTLLYSTLLYSTLLYSTLLYSTLLYSTLLYYAVLYSTLLYSTMLYSLFSFFCSLSFSLSLFLSLLERCVLRAMRVTKGTEELKTNRELARTPVAALRLTPPPTWNRSSEIARLSGEGTVTFSSCEFVEWDEQAKDGRAAIIAESGSLVLQGNSFAQDKKQVTLGAGVKKAVIMGNLIAGKARIDVASNATNVQQGLNACDA